MRSTKIAVTIDSELITRLDRWVKGKAYPSRSAFVGQALSEKLRRLSRARLARECAKLDKREEQKEAELGLVTFPND